MDRAPGLTEELETHEQRRQREADLVFNMPHALWWAHFKARRQQERDTVKRRSFKEWRFK